MRKTLMSVYEWEISTLHYQLIMSSTLYLLSSKSSSEWLHWEMLNFENWLKIKDFRIFADARNAWDSANAQLRNLTWEKAWNAHLKNAHLRNALLISVSSED